MSNLNIFRAFLSAVFGLAILSGLVGCAATRQESGQSATPSAVDGRRGQVHEWAIQNNESAILSLQSGDSRIHATDENGYTPLHWAATLGNAEAVEALLSLGANVHARNKCDLSEISAEAMSVFFEKEFYTPEGIEGVTIKNSCGAIIHFAASSNNRRVIAAVLEAGADIYDRNNQGRSAVHYAAWEDADKSVYELAKHGAGLNVRDDDGETPMHAAAAFGAVNVIDELAVGGAEIDARDTNAATPLHFAILAGESEAMSALIARGADINARIVNGFTPLHLAVGEKNYDAVNTLLNNQADINAQADEGYTVLHGAVRNNDTKAIEGLCEFGANPNIWDGMGNTPLHWAALQDFTESIRALVKGCEADVNIENWREETPLDLAVSEENQAAIDELQKYNAQRGPKS